MKCNCGKFIVCLDPSGMNKLSDICTRLSGLSASITTTTVIRQGRGKIYQGTYVLLAQYLLLDNGTDLGSGIFQGAGKLFAFICRCRGFEALIGRVFILLVLGS